MDPDKYFEKEKEILSFFPLSFAASGESSLITGSPNRTEKRFLFQDDKGFFHIAEGCSMGKKNARIRQNLLLEYFAENRLEGIYPFTRTLSGEHGAVFQDLFWQVRPYIPAENILRNDLAERKETGILWGNFLLQMKEKYEKSSGELLMPNPPFYMADFLPVLLRHAERKMPSITEPLLGFERRLSGFFKWERKAEGMFAHGDFHPGNILMGQEKIKVVIDWEFAGIKFPGYDMALLIGCLAMDHPDHLFSPAVKSLQDLLYHNRFMPDEAWEFLPEMIAATRMGWLGEWLTMEEETLIAQEMALLSILLDQ